MLNKVRCLPSTTDEGSLCLIKPLQTMNISCLILNVSHFKSQIQLVNFFFLLLLFSYDIHLQCTTPSHPNKSLLQNMLKKTEQRQNGLPKILHDFILQHVGKDSQTPKTGSFPSMPSVLDRC